MRNPMYDQRERRRHRRGWPIWAYFFLFFFVLPNLFRVFGEFLPILIILAVIAATFFVMLKVVDPKASVTDSFQTLKGWFTTEYTPPENPETAKLRNFAADAMRRAGHQAAGDQLRLDDIGVLIYEGDTHPRIYRTAEVPTVATHIRPFIVLNQPYMQGSGGHGTIRFNLVDEEGNLRYTNRSRYRLKSGQNFVTPPTWLPLDDQNPVGNWSLQVTVGDQNFAMLDVDWLPVGGEARAQFNGDGEIDELTFKLMTRRAAKETVSLDELLGDQVEEAPIKVSAGASR